MEVEVEWALVEGRTGEPSAGEPVEQGETARRLNAEAYGSNRSSVTGN